MYGTEQHSSLFLSNLNIFLKFIIAAMIITRIILGKWNFIPIDLSIDKRFNYLLNHLINF